MAKMGHSPWSSLRVKLSVAALAGLTTTIVLTVLLLMTAWSASGVIDTARLTQERVRIYTEMQNAARDYQGAAYQGVREPGSATSRRVVETRTRLENLLAQAARLPAQHPGDEVISQRISDQGHAVVKHFRNAGGMVAQVDRAWQERGSRAAMQQVHLLTQPIYALKETLNDEIRRGDSALNSATRDAQSLIQLAVVSALAGLIFAIGFSAVMLHLLHRRMRPGLKRLEAGAQAFGAGDLDHRIGLSGKDELAQLGEAYDIMAKALAEKRDALQRIQLGLERAVAQRTEDLQEANAKLAATDERRRAFMADISHELRTPLTIIRGETQVSLRLAEQPGFDPHEAFERILEQTHDLSRMVDDLFLIARAEAGGLPLDLQPVDLRELCGNIACDFETLASQTGGSITALAGPPVHAVADSNRMRRALAALVENALRHCPPGVEIELAAHVAGETLELSVSDNGPGIDFDNAGMLFERFRRGDTRGEGSGLGLSLVKALVEVHGGRAELRRSLRGGTLAIMRIPLAVSDRAAA